MRNKKGFIALIAVLITGATVFIIAITFSFLAINETDMSLIKQNSNKALALSEVCAETALMKLLNVLNYQGNETIIVEGESCDILTIEGTGNFNRVLMVQSSFSGLARKIKIEINQISPVLQITSWEQVADF